MLRIFLKSKRSKFFSALHVEAKVKAKGILILIGREVIPFPRQLEPELFLALWLACRRVLHVLVVVSISSGVGIERYSRVRTEPRLLAPLPLFKPSLVPPLLLVLVLFMRHPWRLPFAAPLDVVPGM